jgi:hypothetical protein
LAVEALRLWLSGDDDDDTRDASRPPLRRSGAAGARGGSAPATSRGAALAAVPLSKLVHMGGTVGT